MNHFANNLRVLRKSMGLSRERMAAMTGIKTYSLDAYEEGRAEPNIDKLITLSTTLKISIDELVKSELSTKLTPKPNDL